MTITLGWWMLPTFVTFASFGAFFAFNRGQATTYAEAMAGGLLAMISLLIAIIVSLLSWVVYLVLV